MRATCALAPSRYLKNSATKAWVSFLSESGSGDQRKRMPGRNETTSGAVHRAYTPNTGMRCRQPPAAIERAPRGGASTVPLISNSESQLRDRLSQGRTLKGDLDPDLLSTLLKPPQSRGRQQLSDQKKAYPPGPTYTLPKHGEVVKHVPEGKPRKSVAGVAYHGRDGAADLLGRGSEVPFGGIVDQHQRWLVKMQQVGTKNLPQHTGHQWETGIRGL